MVSVKGYTKRDGTRVRPHSRRGSSMAVLGGVALAGALWSYSGKPMPQIDLLTRTEGESTTATVTRVVDGDTFVARDKQGHDLGRVRILGMDAPELAHDGKPAMCGARSAKDEATQILAGKDVHLVTDTNQPDRDDYGRLLRYVDVPTDDGDLDATEELIRRGHAPATSGAQTHDRHHAFAEAQEKAEEDSRGMWSQCR